MGFKKNLLAFSVIGICGVLGHFAYEFSGNIWFLGLFFPVNESIWEHLKLIFFPALSYFLIEYFTSERKPNNYIYSAFCGIFYGIISIIVLYYTISGVLGKNIDFVNIIIFFVAVIITICKRNKNILNATEFSKFKKYTLITFTVIFTVLFFFWSYYPPRLSIFIP